LFPYTRPQIPTSDLLCSCFRADSKRYTLMHAAGAGRGGGQRQQNEHKNEKLSRLKFQWYFLPEGREGLCHKGTDACWFLRRGSVAHSSLCQVDGRCICYVATVVFPFACAMLSINGMVAKEFFVMFFSADTGCIAHRSTRGTHTKEGLYTGHIHRTQYLVGLGFFF
jgi:hypothetical protein